MISIIRIVLIYSAGYLDFRGHRYNEDFNEGSIWHQGVAGVGHALGRRTRKREGDR